MAVRVATTERVATRTERRRASILVDVVAEWGRFEGVARARAESRIATK